jgi:hypothetical protein
MTTPPILERLQLTTKATIAKEEALSPHCNCPVLDPRERDLVSENDEPRNRAEVPLTAHLGWRVILILTSTQD